jgi:hypothetical protein
LVGVFITVFPPQTDWGDTINDLKKGKVAATSDIAADISEKWTSLNICLTKLRFTVASLP